MKTSRLLFVMCTLFTLALVSCDDDSGGDPVAVCGNGFTEAGEQCDDGNTIGGDGCSTNCILEGNICGDGIRSIDEECDDGNTVSGDGCSATCENEGGAVCGNGIAEAGEQCDDGNTVSGDGCSATCQSEGGAVCGNGIMETGETCDDGNTTNGDGCSATCQSEGAVCGNGFVEVGEACDDGNTVSGDGCNATCTSNEQCGNNILDPGEECEPPNSTGCDADCNTVAVECDEADSYDMDCASSTSGQWCWDGGSGGALFCGCDPAYGDTDCQLSGYGTCNAATNRCEPSAPCGVDSFEPNENEGAAAPVAVGSVLNAAICASDADWFQFVADATALDITFVWTDDSATDVDLEVTDCAGTSVASGSSSEADNEILNVTGLTVDATYCIEVVVYSGPASGDDIAYQFLIIEGQECWLDGDCGTGEICGSSVNGRGYCSTVAAANAGCGDDVAGDNDRPSLAEVLTADATMTDGICDGNPSNPVDQDWYMFTLADGDLFSITVNQTSGMTDGDVDVVLYDATGLLVAYAATIVNPEVITGTGIPAGDYYVGVYYYDNDTATAASTTYDIVLSVTPGTGCIDDEECAPLYQRGVCNTGMCEPFVGNAAQQPGDFCDDDSDCDPATTGSIYFSSLCFYADPAIGADNMCIVDCDTEADCTPFGMHCAILDTMSPMGICLPPCQSDAGCSGLTCNTTTNACE